MPNPTEKRKPRRTSLQIEMEAFATLVQTLRPLTAQQRARLINASLTILRDTELSPPEKTDV